MGLGCSSVIIQKTRVSRRVVNSSPRDLAGAPCLEREQGTLRMGEERSPPGVVASAFQAVSPNVTDGRG
jgi:hypothetical protein